MKPAVAAALQGIEGVENVFFYYPDSFAAVPCVSYYEAANAIAGSADDGEYMSAVSFVVDIWSLTSSDNSRIAGLVNGAMAGIGFLREFASDVYDPAGGYRHYSMRFQYMGG